jgi:large subunit ribosomal protein L21
MKAIFVTGGKQYQVTEGDTIYVEKLEAEPNTEITFDEVLMVDDKIGTPTVKGAKVICNVEKQGRQKKITIFKFVQKNKFRHKQGHRQPYTKLTVKSIVK